MDEKTLVLDQAAKIDAMKQVILEYRKLRPSVLLEFVEVKADGSKGKN